MTDPVITVLVMGGSGSNLPRLQALAATAARAAGSDPAAGALWPARQVRQGAARGKVSGSGKVSTGDGTGSGT